MCWKSGWMVLVLSLGVGATPLMTEEYPLWVRDAVLTLREKGVISAGCLPNQAVNRGELTPILERWLEIQSRDQGELGGQAELDEIRQLLESLRVDLDKAEQRVDSLESRP